MKFDGLYRIMVALNLITPFCEVVIKVENNKIVLIEKIEKIKP